VTGVRMVETEDKILDFFRAVFTTYDINKDGCIDVQELDKVLAALGRVAPQDTVDDLISRFDIDSSGKIEWNNGEFLMVIASISVTDVSTIDDFVFSAAFRTFDQDADGLITPLEMHIVVRLFLPMDTDEQDKFVEELIQKMDTNVDGKIDFQEFVQFVKESGNCDILSSQTSRSSGGDTTHHSEDEMSQNVTKEIVHA